MIRSELDAAGIESPELRSAYQRCREINAAHGRTFFLATRLLAPEQRPPVHALYGFARYADDILDDFNPALDTATRAARLQQLSEEFFAHGDHSTEPVLAAVSHTARRYGISDDLFDDFLTSMRMDLTITDYPNRAALNVYMKGSAEAIGLQLLPILGTIGPTEQAAPYAAALGRAFQLTNFLRDIDEDLSRQRVYLPADEFAACGVDRDLLMWCHSHRSTDHRVRNALADQHDVARQVYRYAADGITLLAPRSRACVATALTLYSDILDRIEESDYAVFTRRATVGNARRLRVAGSGLLRSWRVRLLHPAQSDNDRSGVA
ncbi:phytoene/squalene synthase family protein [Mycobacterium sp.]|uniref:phytoene/squalene synthase family protein n=1 Tax=Mycobacterium sp. TaxID=1785 RepID=UPI003C70D19A